MDENGLCVLAPLRLEATASQRGAVTARVTRTGMGRRRSLDAARRVVTEMAANNPAAVVGLCGGLTSDLEPGDIVVASEVRSQNGDVSITLPGASLLAAWLAEAGLPVRCGAMVSTDRLMTGPQRQTLAADGALAVDMESAWLIAGIQQGDPQRPVAVVRVVLDTPRHELRSQHTLRNLPLARRRLTSVIPTLERWAEVTGPRQVLLASPRSFCAGVERAIEIVDRALDLYEPPIYVRRQIVHNIHVVQRLERRGAIFVQEVDEVPPGSVLVFAAHGVSPEVRDNAERRQLKVIDATCPLVAKVHTEARYFADRGYDIILVGHAEHEEVEGTVGEVPGRITVVATTDDVDRLEVTDPDRVAYLTQTTLAVHETDGIVTRLRERFPTLAGPRREDICYATQNRQEAIAAIAGNADLVLVIGSPNSSNSRRLAEVASRAGVPAHLIDECSDMRLDWLQGANTIAITAGASAPESKVAEVVAAIGALGDIDVREHKIIEETVTFKLPREVRV